MAPYEIDNLHYKDSGDSRSPQDSCPWKGVVKITKDRTLALF